MTFGNSSAFSIGRQLATVVAVCLLDQATKWYVVAHWDYQLVIPIIPGFFSLVHLRNTGAAWGVLREHTGLLSLLSVAVLVMVVWQADKIIEGRAERAFALALITGGILGNLADRVCRSSVVDFLLFYYRSYQWPAFNVADSAITCGVAIYIISSILHPNAPVAPAPPAAGNATGAPDHADVDRG